MGPTWLLCRAWLRRRGAAALVLVLLLGIGTGTGVAAIAGARRTASAYERVLDAARAPDVISGHALPPDEAVARVSALDGVRRAATDVGFTGYVAGYDPLLVPYYIGAYDHAITLDRPLLVSGRWPDPEVAEEIIMSSQAARAAGLDVGDEVTVDFFTPDFDVEPRELRIVGIGDERQHELGDASAARSAIRLTPAFTRANLDLQQWSRTTFVANDLPAMLDSLVAAGYPIDETRSSEHQRVQESLRPIVLALAAMGAVALLGTALVGFQALLREADLRAADRRTLEALGVTRGERRRTELALLALMAVPAAALAAGVAIALSPLAPLGRVRDLDPARGVDLDWPVLLAGAALVLLLFVAHLPWAARRAAQDRSAPSAVPSMRGQAGPVAATGLQLALGGTGEGRRRFWLAVILTTVALSLVVGTVTFLAGLDRLSSDTTRYGFTWDLASRNAYGEVEAAELLRTFGDDPDVVGLAGSSVRNVVLDRRITTPGMAVEQVSGEFWPTIAAGRAPAAPDEVLLGERTMERAGVALGDELMLSLEAPGGGEAATETVTVVGRAVFAPIELAGLEPPSLDEGIAIDFDTYRSLNERTALGRDAFDMHPDIVYFDLADGVAPQDVIDRYPEGVPDARQTPTEWLRSVAPAAVIESERASPMYTAALVPLTLVVLGTIAHAQITLVRQRRRDLAVLKALGFTRGQLRTAVTWLAMAGIVVPLAVALPLGVALGRFGWSAFARLVGVIDVPVVPVTAILVTAAATLVLVNAVSLVPAALAARVSPARTLHRD